MNKKHGLFCVVLGTALLIAALSLVLYNKNENKKSGEAAQSVLNELMEIIPPSPTEPATEAITGSDILAEYDIEPVTEAKVEPTISIAEKGYIGIVSIPALELNLPVMSEWSYVNLDVSPCRYKGSVADGDVIIAAHNYWSHFGRLSELGGGEIFTFTEADGRIHTYEITEIIQLDGRDINGMDFGSADSWDMTLFTCTLSGQSRVTVRAVEIE
ncbi:MAG: sortase [Ruminococcus sp.]|nr:sortase [Ruminococcus sp.]